MTYQIGICAKNIKSIRNPIKLSYSQVKKIVAIDQQHFNQKNNWYLINNRTCYYKDRSDARLLGELLSSDIINLLGKESGLATANYTPVFLGKKDKLGLASENIQSSDFAYYDLVTLSSLFPRLSKKYGQHTLSGLLDVLKNDKVHVPNFDEIKNQIITIYVIDWFTHQLDRNPRNILFECNLDEKGSLSSMNLAKIIDSETSFAVSKSHLIDTSFSKIWVPAIPYNDVDFKKRPERIEGLDYNIVNLLLDYPEETIAVLNRVLSTNFDQIVGRYSKRFDSEIYVCDDCISFLKAFTYEKLEEAEKIKSLW